MTVVHGRLFGPDLAGTGVVATGGWRGKQLLVAAGGREFASATPAVAAGGFNAARVRLSWTTAAGDYVFMPDSARDAAALADTAPPMLKASFAAVAGRRQRVERNFRRGIVAVAFVLLLPFAGLGLFLFKAEAVAGWVVAQIPHASEASLGDLVLAQTRVQMKLMKSGPAVEALRNIGERLTPGSAHRYRWYIAERGEINAFAAPGGVVVVFAGLIRAAETPEELAGVIAHEVAHAELRHGLQGMVKSLGLRALLAIVTGDVSGGALANAASGLADMRFSRDAEREADAEGLKRLRAAQIDPQGMLAFFARQAKLENASPPAILSTHPATDERMANLRRGIEANGGTAKPLPIDWPAVVASLGAGRPDR
jgi:Zn-dependent protease with chaperone function